MLFKLIVVALLIFIFTNLGIGLYHLVRHKGQSNRVVRSLTWRIGLSVVLFIGLFIAYYFGLMQPNPMPLTG